MIRLVAITLHGVFLTLPLWFIHRTVEGLFSPHIVVPILTLLIAAECELRTTRHQIEWLGSWRNHAMQLATGLFLLVAAWVGLGSAALRDGETHWVGLGAGFLCMALGISLRIAAMRNLGEAFQSQDGTQVGQMLIQGGIHRHLRHPSEAGLLLLAGGLALATLSSASAIVVCGLLVPLGVLRVFREEKALDQAFPEIHPKYKRRVNALIPGVF
jgi:protein-S-isoprenylcysteine O-methyltransferase Ste14